MSTEDNKALVHRLFEEVWNQGKMHSSLSSIALPPSSTLLAGPFMVKRA